MPTDPTDPLSNQNMKDRYYGINDPVAEKLLRLSNQLPKLTAPDDKSITSLYVGGVEHDITEKDLRYVTPIPRGFIISCFILEIIFTSLVNCVTSTWFLVSSVPLSTSLLVMQLKRQPQHHLTSSLFRVYTIYMKWL